MNNVPQLQLLKNTLLVIPCSAAKRCGSEPGNAISILSALDPAREASIAKARAAIRVQAKLDENSLMPAYRRYSGQLYKHASAAVGAALTVGQRVLIVSGGYGILVANEPIGWYDKRFVLSDWPQGLLERCILDYARHERIRSVIAVMSSTSGYAKLIRRVDWKGANLAATPIVVGSFFARGWIL